MKCPVCLGTGKVFEKTFSNGFYLKCSECNGTGKIEQTEQEYIQTCNTEELAEFLCDVWHGIDEVINIMSEDGEISKKDAMKLWLKQPHTTKE